MLFKLFMTSLLPFFEDAQVIVGTTPRLHCCSARALRLLDSASSCCFVWLIAPGMVAIMLHSICVLLLQPFIRKLDDRLHQLALADLFLVVLRSCSFPPRHSALCSNLALRSCRGTDFPVRPGDPAQQQQGARFAHRRGHVCRSLPPLAHFGQFTRWCSLLCFVSPQC